MIQEDRSYTSVTLLIYELEKRIEPGIQQLLPGIPAAWETDDAMFELNMLAFNRHDLRNTPTKPLSEDHLEIVKEIVFGNEGAYPNIRRFSTDFERLLSAGLLSYGDLGAAETFFMKYGDMRPEIFVERVPYVPLGCYLVEGMYQDAAGFVQEVFNRAGEYTKHAECNINQIYVGFLRHLADKRCYQEAIDVLRSVDDAGYKDLRFEKEGSLPK